MQRIVSKSRVFYVLYLCFILDADLVLYVVELCKTCCSLLDASLHSCDLALVELFKLSGLESALIHIVHSECEVDVEGNKLTLTLANNNVGLSLEKCLYCEHAESRCENSVNKCAH